MCSAMVLQPSAQRRRRCTGWPGYHRPVHVMQLPVSHRAACARRLSTYRRPRAGCGPHRRRRRRRRRRRQTALLNRHSPLHDSSPAAATRPSPTRSRARQRRRPRGLAGLRRDRARPWRCLGTGTAAPLLLGEASRVLPLETLAGGLGRASSMNAAAPLVLSAKRKPSATGSPPRRAAPARPEPPLEASIRFALPQTGGSEDRDQGQIDCPAHCPESVAGSRGQGVGTR